jgi:hypothetical protein
MAVSLGFAYSVGMWATSIGVIRASGRYLGFSYASGTPFV